MDKVNLRTIKAAILRKNNDFISFAEVIVKLTEHEGLSDSEAAQLLQQSGVSAQNMAVRNEVGVVNLTDSFAGLHALIDQCAAYGMNSWVRLQSGEQAHAEGYGWIRSSFVAALKAAGLNPWSVEALSDRDSYQPMPGWGETYDDPALMAAIAGLRVENEELRAELATLKAQANLHAAERIPEELILCLKVWAAAQKIWTPSGGVTPKKVIETVIEDSYSYLPQNVKSRISAVCNWDKSSGRKNYSNSETLDSPSDRF